MIHPVLVESDHRQYALAVRLSNPFPSNKRWFRHFVLAPHHLKGTYNNLYFVGSHGINKRLHHCPQGGEEPYTNHITSYQQDNPKSKNILFPLYSSLTRSIDHIEVLESFGVVVSVYLQVEAEGPQRLSVETVAQILQIHHTYHFIHHLQE